MLEWGIIVAVALGLWAINRFLEGQWYMGAGLIVLTILLSITLIFTDPGKPITKLPNVDKYEAVVIHLEDEHAFIIFNNDSIVRKVSLSKCVNPGELIETDEPLEIMIFSDGDRKMLQVLPDC